MRSFRTASAPLLLLLAVLLGCGGPAARGTPSAAASVPVVLTPSPSQGLRISRPENLSAGDPYAPELGNRGYDVQRYTLRLALDPTVAFIDGQATIEALSTVEGLDQVSLDLVGFAVETTTVDGTAVDFFREGKKLVLNLPEALASGAAFTLQVAYSGEPVREPSRYVPFVSHLGLHVRPDNTLFVVAEPDGARYWFPANDHPRDKASFRFELLVPEGLTGVANGLLLETKRSISGAFPDGRSGDLYIWEHRYPMAAAFATVAVGEYVCVEGRSLGGVLLRHYVFPQYEDTMRSLNDLLGEMIDWMGEHFGPYPFEAFGYVTVSGLGASLETQTLVILDGQAIDDEMVLAHEMAHMWFGDWVSLDSWGDIWRSEGFATYVQYMWDTGGYPEALEQVMSELHGYVTERPSGHPLVNPPPAEMFGRDSYLKGAVVVHALRQEMGDEAFFAGLKAYFQRYGGGTATHAEFQAAMEEAGGAAIDEFFAEWFQ